MRIHATCYAQTNLIAVPVDAEPGDVPMFWACGVIPRGALMASTPPLAITHIPGPVLVTDMLDAEDQIGGT
jgi:uncharacterized protein YcsI (UPF0317 family)